MARWLRKPGLESDEDPMRQRPRRPAARPHGETSGGARAITPAQAKQYARPSARSASSAPKRSTMNADSHDAALTAGAGSSAGAAAAVSDAEASVNAGRRAQGRARGGTSVFSASRLPLMALVFIGGMVSLGLEMCG